MARMSSDVPDANEIEAWLIGVSGMLHNRLIAIGVEQTAARRAAEAWRVGVARDAERLLILAAIAATPTPVAERRARE